VGITVGTRPTRACGIRRLFGGAAGFSRTRCAGEPLVRRVRATLGVADA
jgi:hypothetical protein